jgi:Uma2 family endonuclease
MSTDSALQEVLNSHWLPQFAEQIEEKLSKERAARERFYDEMSESDKTEFIDGVVIVHSPARDWHTEAVQNLQMLLHFWDSEATGIVRSEKALCVFTRNDYEPDVVYFGRAKAALIEGSTLKYPVPDFIAEVLSESTEKYDRGVKFQDYEAHKVAEYWIIDPKTKVVEQYLLNSIGKYELVKKAGQGVLASEALSGFTIPVQAIFDRKLHRAAIQQFFGGAK